MYGCEGDGIFRLGKGEEEEEEGGLIWSWFWGSFSLWFVWSLEITLSIFILTFL